MDEFCAAVMQLADEQPLVLAVDDIHKADFESLGCLGHLARRMVTSRVLAVFSHRPGPCLRTPPRAPSSPGSPASISCGCLR